MAAVCNPTLNLREHQPTRLDKQIEEQQEKLRLCIQFIEEAIKLVEARLALLWRIDASQEYAQLCH
jgi:hypothetical protein